MKDVDTISTPRTATALQARRTATDEMVERISQVLRQMRREHAAVTVAAVARRSGVSRTFLYQNERARGLVEAGGVPPGPTRRRAAPLRRPLLRPPGASGP